MKTKDFLKLLKENRNKELLFEYQEGKFIDANYHLTEIKNVNFETVDCGGKENSWKETQIQLWESPTAEREYLRTDKVISIFERVNSINPLWLDTELKVEFGNADFHTSVMKIASFQDKNEGLIIQLFEEKTLCKANPDCGIEDKKEDEEACCSTNSSCC